MHPSFGEASAKKRRWEMEAEPHVRTTRKLAEALGVEPKELL